MKCSGHLAFVSNEAHTTLQVQTYLVDQGTPYGFLGVITLEDIIEELIGKSFDVEPKWIDITPSERRLSPGEEIADETDVHQRPPSSPHYSIDVDGFKVNTDFGIVDESSGDSLNFGGERATLHSSVRSVNVRSANSVAPDSPLMSSSRSVGDYESKPLLPSSRK